MKHGFTLIEILIASLIASMISTSLLLTIMQLNTAQKKLLDLTSQYERAATVMQQFERDIMGAFIPIQAIPLPKPAEPKKDQQSPDTQAGSGKPASVQTPPTPPKKQPKPVEQIFEGTEKNGQFDMLTFITDNPLTFMQAQNGKPKPRMVRVVYRLEQDSKRKNSFNLKWQEGTNLTLSAYTKDAKNELRPYTIIEGIASMKVHYLMLDPEKNKEEKKEESGKDGQTHEKKKQKKRVYKKVSQWKQKKDDKQKTIQLPEAVEVTLELWDSIYERKNLFTFVVPLFGSLTMQLPDEKKSKESGAASTAEASSATATLVPQVAQAESSPLLPSSDKHALMPVEVLAMRNKVKRAHEGEESNNEQAPHNTNDMSWLERVKLHDGATLTVNGENYEPAA